MRPLNECLGDGRSIPVRHTLIVDDDGKFRLTELSKDELQRLQNKEEEKIAKDCAEEVKKRFEDYRKFFFDDQYMMKCRSSSSAASLEKCAGKEYYMFVRKLFDDHYFL